MAEPTRRQKVVSVLLYLIICYVGNRYYLSHVIRPFGVSVGGYPDPEAEFAFWLFSPIFFPAELVLTVLILIIEVLYWAYHLVNW